jgi:voltage-gated potassium channel
MPESEAERNERWSVLRDLEDWLEWPMIALAVIWFTLFILEVTRGLGPFLSGLTIAIWIAFILEFALRLFLAPERTAFLRSNWLTIIALFVPALRVLRVFASLRAVQAVRLLRGTRLVRSIASVNRGMRALGATMRRRGIGYVITLTTLVVLLGAAGILGLEAGANDRLNTFSDALWWAAMMMTTMGSDAWPVTAEGRLLAVLMAVYAFTIFGYVTATLATYFVGQDAESRDTAIASEESIQALRRELVSLKEQLGGLTAGGERKPGSE